MQLMLSPLCRPGSYTYYSDSDWRAVNLYLLRLCDKIDPVTNAPAAMNRRMLAMGDANRDFALRCDCKVAFGSKLNSTVMRCA